MIKVLRSQGYQNDAFNAVVTDAAARLEEMMGGPEEIRKDGSEDGSEDVRKPAQIRLELAIRLFREERQCAIRDVRKALQGTGETLREELANIIGEFLMNITTWEELGKAISISCRMSLDEWLNSL